MPVPNAMFVRALMLTALVSPFLFGTFPGHSESPQHAVPNFNLTDLRGKNHELRRVEAKAVVLFFTGNGCPIARKSIDKLKALRERFGPDVVFWLVNTYAADSAEDCRKEYKDFNMWPLTYLRDPKQAVALVLGVERTAEVVAIGT
jgi:peroxiredoxin